LKREQIQVLDEAFLTSSSRGIVPIVEIDDLTVGEGIPGLITKRLTKAYEEYVLQAAEKI
jgi:branched-subunit amino acid aminotransferase/4-amino-4-deoxychorismate lyase